MICFTERRDGTSVITQSYKRLDGILTSQYPSVCRRQSRRRDRAHGALSCSLGFLGLPLWNSEYCVQAVAGLLSLNTNRRQPSNERVGEWHNYELALETDIVRGTQGGSKLWQALCCIGATIVILRNGTFDSVNWSTACHGFDIYRYHSYGMHPFLQLLSSLDLQKPFAYC